MADETYPADMKPCPPLWHACKHGFYDQVYTLLFEEGVDNEERGGRYHTTPLMVAALHYRETIVKLLLTASADITATDDRGMTALQLATSEQHLPVMALLMSTGGNPDDVVGVQSASCKIGRRRR